VCDVIKGGGGDADAEKRPHNDPSAARGAAYTFRVDIAAHAQASFGRYLKFNAYVGLFDPIEE
jgi:hypothetical protein